MRLSTVYRVQNRDGRGPFQPGFTQEWADPSGPERPPTFLEECGLPNFELGYHYGTAVRTYEDLGRWFTLEEMRRLDRRGFYIVSLWPDKIIAESPNQLVFARRLPLWDGYIIRPWPWERRMASPRLI